MRGVNCRVGTVEFARLAALREALSAVQPAALPTIWCDGEASKSRGRSVALRDQHDLAVAFIAACDHIRKLEAKLSVLEGRTQP